MVHGQSGLPAAVTRDFSRAWRWRCKTKGAAIERRWRKRKANRAARRSHNGDFARSTGWEVS